MRQLRRYPVRPVDVHLFNVVATPIDITTPLFVPALVACVAAAGAHSGPQAALAMLAATVVLVAVTAAIGQLALAATQRWLRNEWTRTGASLLSDASDSAAWLGNVREALANVPTVSLPALIGVGVMTAHPMDALVGLGGSIVLFALLVWGGATLSGRAAMEPLRSGVATGARRRVAARAGQARASVFASLVARELRAARPIRSDSTQSPCAGSSRSRSPRARCCWPRTPRRFWRT